MSVQKMTPEEFSRLRRLFIEALGTHGAYTGKDLAPADQIDLGDNAVFKETIDIRQVAGGQGTTFKEIPRGEWSLIQAMQGGR